MLFGYPIEATAENWLHECLMEMVQTTHESIRSGNELPLWPNIIPAAHRSKLKRRTKLKRCLEDYQKAAATLSDAELVKISVAAMNQNNISDLLAGKSTCEKLDNFPDAVKEPIKALFGLGFELLSDFEIRDRQYKLISDKVSYHICPFCGCEFFDAPGAPRDALDHYLARSKYPFAASNLRNLVPMGHNCNSKYKLAKDVLYRDDGTRRPSYDPYSKLEGVKISLKGSIPFARRQGYYDLPEWKIDFYPNTEEVSTWDTVFQIEERYKRDNLDYDFVSWLNEFQKYCLSYQFKPVTDQDVLDALDSYLVYLKGIGIRDKAFLKFAVFDMLSTYYKNGDKNVRFFVNTLAIGGIA